LLEGSIIARLERGGEKFEVFVDEDKAYNFKSGFKKDFSNVLSVDEIFKDAKKGDRQSEAELKKVFGTSDPVKVGEIIVKEGELQLTTERRRKLLEEKKAKIVSLISRNCVDPHTKAPHPPQRIESALDEVKFKVDLFKSVDKQMEEAVEKLREILPIKIENIKIAVKVDSQFAGKAFGILKEFGLEKSEYGSDGSLIGVCVFPAGLQDDFYNKMNKLTGGSVQTKVL
jgi:ribosome maturation protein SDO1